MSDFWDYCRQVASEIGDVKTACYCLLLRSYYGTDISVNDAIIRINSSVAPVNPMNYMNIEARIRELGEEQRILAIKEFRQLTGVGLREARDFVYKVLGLPVDP